MTISKVIQARLRTLAQEKSWEQMSRESGVSVSILRKMANGSAWALRHNVDMVCEYLGLELRKRRNRGGK